jgi:hypothetical protein
MSSEYINDMIWYDMIWYVYLSTAIGLTLGGNSTVHIYTQYTEQHKETKYLEWNIHNNKNT